MNDEPGQENQRDLLHGGGLRDGAHHIFGAAVFDPKQIKSIPQV